MHIQRKLLIVLLAISFIPATFVSYALFYSARDLLERAILSNLASAADGTRIRIEEYLSERNNDLFIMGHLDVVRKALPALNRFYKDRSSPAYRDAEKAVDLQLAEIQHILKYVDIVLTSTEGRIIYAYAPDRKLDVGALIQNRDAVSRQAQAGVYIGDIHETACQDRTYAMFLAAPMNGGNGTALGLIRLELDMRPIYEILASVPFTTRTLEVLLAQRISGDTILFISPLKYAPGTLLKKKVRIGSNEGLPAQKATSGENGSGLSVDYRGVRVLSSWQPIPSTGWGLVAKLDFQEALKPIARLRTQLIIMVLAIVCSSIMTALSIAKSISQPIHELHSGVEMIENGNWDFAIRTETRDEIGQLSRAFDDMVVNFRKTTVSKDYLDCIMASMADSLIVIDPEEKIITVNAATYALLGYKEEDLIGKDIGVLIPEERIPFGSEGILKSLNGGTFRNYETSYKAKDARLIPVIISGGVFKKIACPDGLPKDGCRLFMQRGEHCHKYLGAVWVAKDITERKRAEGTLAETAKAKSDFASAVSHELRTPLTAIKQGISIVLDGMAGAINGDQKEFLSLAKRNVDRLNRLINDVLDIQKSEARKMESNIQENDINELAAEVHSTMAPLADKKNLELTLQLEEGLPKVRCDRDRIVQVLMNLVNNAIKFTEKGGIVIASSRGENIIRVCVKDTGAGIKEEDMERLFRPFEQLEESADKTSGATGLGLAISKSIIDKHRGKIWAESEFGKGSTFCFILPVKEKRAS